MANPKFSELPAAAALTGTETLPVVQGGGAVRTTPSDIVSLPAANKAVTGEIAAVNVVADTAYTLAPGDKGALVVFTNTNPVTLTVPAGFKKKAVVYLKQGSSGQVTCSADAGVTLETASTLKTRTARSVIALIFHDDDKATVVGDME